MKKKGEKMSEVVGTLLCIMYYHAKDVVTIYSRYLKLYKRINDDVISCFKRFKDDIISCYLGRS